MSITTDLNLIGAEDAGKIRKFKIKNRSTNFFSETLVFWEFFIISKMPKFSPGLYSKDVNAVIIGFTRSISDIYF